MSFVFQPLREGATQAEMTDYLNTALYEIELAMRAIGIVLAREEPSAPYDGMLIVTLPGGWSPAGATAGGVAGYASAIYYYLQGEWNRLADYDTYAVGGP